MIKKILFLLTISLTLFAVDTTTDTTFENKTDTSMDSFGNAVFEQDVKITTNNFKVDNFWKKFKNDGESDSQSTFDTISKSATIQVSVESSSICSLYSQLNTAGCSGQKPFLINNEALVGKNVDDTISLLFQKDYDLADDTILYNDINNSVFYPLDIDRTQKYYVSQDDNTKSFFGIFSLMFNTFFGEGGFFSNFFNFGVVDNNENNAEDIRQRYIANITAGVDQDHLLEKGVTALKTTALNTPVSLIDYTEKVTEDGGCNLFFFKFSEDNMFCNIMGGMPFITMFSNTTPTTSYEIDTIEVDTENSIISFASSYTGMTITEYQEGTVYQAQSDESVNINPISAMMGMMKCFFFGCSSQPEMDKVEEPMDTYYAFDDDTAVNLTFAVTNDGNKIDDFQNFKLMGIHSLTGSEHMCRVKESNDYDDWTDYTFKPEGTESQTFTAITEAETQTWCDDKTWGQPDYQADSDGSCDGWDSSYEKEITPESADTNLKTPEEWLTWCDEAMENNTPTTSTVCDTFFFMKFNCREVIDPIFVDGYEIAQYVNASKRGLFLDLKLIKLDVTDKANTVRYSIQKIK